MFIITFIFLVCLGDCGPSLSKLVKNKQTNKKTQHMAVFPRNPNKAGGQTNTTQTYIPACYKTNIIFDKHYFHFLPEFLDPLEEIAEL